MVPKEGFEPTRPCGHYALNVARLPFRHFGKYHFSTFVAADHAGEHSRFPLCSPTTSGGRSRT